MDKLPLYIESLIFASKNGVTISDIKAALEESFEVKIKEAEILKSLDSLIERYSGEEYAIEINIVDEAYNFMSKSAYHHIIGNLLKIQSKKKLSTAALETLSIIAYKQPVTKSEIESIRGVNSDYTVQKLLEKELCEITGRDDGPGRPLLYGTSKKFMNYFGLKSIKELPRLNELEQDQDSVGSPEEIEEYSTSVPIKNEEE